MPNKIFRNSIYFTSPSGCWSVSGYPSAFPPSHRPLSVTSTQTTVHTCRVSSNGLKLKLKTHNQTQTRVIMSSADRRRTRDIECFRCPGDVRMAARFPPGGCCAACCTVTAQGANAVPGKPSFRLSSCKHMRLARDKHKTSNSFM